MTTETRKSLGLVDVYGRPIEDNPDYEAMLRRRDAEAQWQRLDTVLDITPGVKPGCYYTLMRRAGQVWLMKSIRPARTENNHRTGQAETWTPDGEEYLSDTGILCDRYRRIAPGAAIHPQEFSCCATAAANEEEARVLANNQDKRSEGMDSAKILSNEDTTGWGGCGEVS